MLPIINELHYFNKDVKVIYSEYGSKDEYKNEQKHPQINVGAFCYILSTLRCGIIPNKNNTIKKT